MSCALHEITQGEMYSIYLMYFDNSIRFALTKVLIQITRKASRKSDIDEIAFTQNHPSGQKLIRKCSLVQIKHVFRVHITYY